MSKTKIMVFGSQTIDQHIELNGIALENVEDFEYLGSIVIWASGYSKDIHTRIQKVQGGPIKTAHLKKVYNSCI